MSRFNKLLKGKRSVFFGNTMALMAMQCAKYLFPLLTLPYLTRVLGPDLYAVRAYVVSFMVFIQTFLDYGFAQYGTKLVAENVASRAELESISINIYATKILFIPLGITATFVASIFIPILFNNLLFVALSFISISLKSLLPDYLLQGLEDMKAIAYRFVATQMLALMAIFVFIKGPDQLLFVPVFEGLASLLSIAWTEFYLRSQYGIRFGKLRLAKIKEIVAQSTPFFLATAASSIMASTITILMGVFPTNALIISCWSISATVIQGLQALWQPISKSLFPHMVKKRDFTLVSRLLKVGEPIVALVAILCFLFADSIMLVLGGEAYVEGSTVLKLVAPTLLFSYPISLLGYPVIGALGKSSNLSRCIMVSASFQLAFLVLAGLLGYFNVGAIAIARVGSEALLCFLEVNVARSILGANQDNKKRELND